MSVDHRRLFERVARELPSSLKEHLFVAGSLAAACHFAPRLQGQVVNTKDADLVIHPARDLQSAADIARQLLTNGWRRRDDCTPAKSAEPAEALRAIRLYPPEHDDYFVELLTVPEAGSSGKAWVALELDDGWYGLPSFEFLALTSFGRERSEAGLEYAAPA